MSEVKLLSVLRLHYRLQRLLSLLVLRLWNVEGAEAALA